MGLGLDERRVEGEGANGGLGFRHSAPQVWECLIWSAESLSASLDWYMMDTRQAGGLLVLSFAKINKVFAVLASDDGYLRIQDGRPAEDLKIGCTMGFRPPSSVSPRSHAFYIWWFNWNTGAINSSLILGIS